MGPIASPGALYAVPSATSSGAASPGSAARDAESLLSAYRLLFIGRDGFSEALSSASQGALRSFAASHAGAVAGSWTAETAGASLELLEGGGAEAAEAPWYGSFVLDGSPAAELPALLPAPAAQLLAPPPQLPGATSTGALWAFFGRNGGSAPLLGKPEHADALRPGVVTLHAQLSGAKAWRLRPNAAVPWGPSGPPAVPAGHLEVCCRAGDRLLIDTGAWYHETSLPPGTELSLSLARDFAVDGRDRQEEVSSMQVRVTRALCGRCRTPTATPLGLPPGTCGCTCCSARRRHKSDWQALRRSSLMAQKVLMAQMEELLRSLSHYSLSMRDAPLALCDG